MHDMDWPHCYNGYIGRTLKYIQKFLLTCLTQKHKREWKEWSEWKKWSQSSQSEWYVICVCVENRCAIKLIKSVCWACWVKWWYTHCSHCREKETISVNKLEQNVSTIRRVRRTFRTLHHFALHSFISSAAIIVNERFFSRFISFSLVYFYSSFFFVLKITNQQKKQ